MLIEVRGVGPTLRGELVQPIDLRQTDRRMEVAHAEVEAEHVVVIAPLHAVATDHAAALGEHIRICSDHPAFAGHHVLGGVKAETAGAKTAHPAAAVRRADRLRRVLDHRQAVPLRSGQDGVHIAGITVEMHRHDGFSSRSDGRRDELRVDVERGLVDIDEDGPSAGIDDAVDRGLESERRGDDLVTGADAVSQQGGMEGGRTVGSGHRELRAGGCGEFLLKPRGTWALH